MSSKRSVPGNLAILGDKITGYLLKPDHPRGGSKAKFFLGLGFSPSKVGEFADALFAHAMNPHTEVSFVQEGGIEKMVCVGVLWTPSGQWTRVRSIWVLTQPDTAQLVTAIPARRAPSTV